MLELLLFLYFLSFVNYSVNLLRSGQREDDVVLVINHKLAKERERETEHARARL